MYHGGDVLVARMLAFYTDDPRKNPTEVNSFDYLGLGFDSLQSFLQIQKSTDKMQAKGKIGKKVSFTIKFTQKQELNDFTPTFPWEASV